MPETVPVAERIKWRTVVSSNVRAVGWDKHKNMYIEFKGNTIYMYPGVSRQRAVMVSRQPSVGWYVNHVIIPSFQAVRIEPPHPEE